jgi:hypothetical protein
MLPLITYAPIVINASVIAYKVIVGIRRIEIQTLTSGSDMTSKITFERPKLAIRPQAISGLFAKSVGPGVSPLIVKAPSKIAMVADDGIPRVIKGMKLEIPKALFAVSGPATP